MPRLYDLLAEFSDAYDAAIDAATDDGELTPGWAERLAAVEASLDDKIRAYGGLIKSLSSDRDAITKEADLLAARAASLNNRVETLKDAVKSAMIAAGKKKVVGTPTVSLCDNSQVSVLIDDLSAIPERFYVTPAPQLSRTAVASAIVAGETVPGARLEKGCHVRVR